MKQATIGLAMIVKDAEEHIGRCIKSALPLISYWTIIDTGSTDATEQIAQGLLAGVPGGLLHDEFKGFDYNRTSLLRVARDHADYTLMLDADMELKYTDLPPLIHDEYRIMIYDRGLEYALPLLTSNSKDFFYSGVAHACLCTNESGTSEADLRQMWVIDHGGGGGRPGKIERDRDLLKAQVERDPTDRRSWFYLAQSYRDLDQHADAVQAYLKRASMGGWDEEIYYSLYQAGQITCSEISFAVGAQYLLDAYKMRPWRSEALRALSNSAENVADKIPFPKNDVLFVTRSAYKDDTPSGPVPPMPNLGSLPKRLWNPHMHAPPTFKNTTAVIVTRGNVDLAPIISSLPYDDVVIWDNAKRVDDYKVFGRYMGIFEAQHPFIYFQDDDIVFTEHEKLLAAYEPGTLVGNMDQPWVEATGYPDKLVMLGAGSIMDAHVPMHALTFYLENYPADQRLLYEADFIVGMLAKGKRVDLGYEAREFTDDPDRLYRQPWQTEWKWEAINRCAALLEQA